MHDNTTHQSSSEIPYGYCHCGCGQKTKPAVHDDKRYGHIKGQPQHYVFGHGSRKLVGVTGPNPSGLCMCGCGQPTKIAKQTHLSKGWVAGQPVCFVAGHNNAPFRESLEEAFHVYCTPGNPAECWPWQGPTSREYGCVKWRNVRYFAHRIAYELYYGPITVGENPHDTSVCHKCDNPICCNPHHLFLGTQADNNADRDRKGRQVATKGSNNGNAKLSENDVKEIRRRSANGESYAALGRHYSTTKTNISYIVNRKAWKHVT